MEMNSSEKIGFHKGSLATLAKEREQFVKMVALVDSLMQAHLNELKSMGVDLEAEARKAMDAENKDKKGRPSAEEELGLA